MTDIVEKLRNAETSVRLPNGSIDLVNHVAADEIERLREALREVEDLLIDAMQSDCEHGVRSLNEQAAAEYLVDFPATRNAFHQSIDIARAALGEGK